MWNAGEEITFKNTCDLHREYNFLYFYQICILIEDSLFLYKNKKINSSPPTSELPCLGFRTWFAFILVSFHASPMLCLTVSVLVAGGAAPDDTVSQAQRAIIETAVRRLPPT